MLFHSTPLILFSFHHSFCHLILARSRGARDPNPPFSPILRCPVSCSQLLNLRFIFMLLLFPFPSPLPLFRLLFVVPDQQFNCLAIPAAGLASQLVDAEVDSANVIFLQVDVGARARTTLKLTNKCDQELIWEAVMGGQVVREGEEQTGPFTINTADVAPLRP